jgi:hypothetical protein
MDFTITITETSHLAGITAARAVYNNSLSMQEGELVENHPDYKATDEAYVQFVMSKAAESYSIQYATV